MVQRDPLGALTHQRLRCCPKPPPLKEWGEVPPSHPPGCPFARKGSKWTFKDPEAFGREPTRDAAWDGPSHASFTGCGNPVFASVISETEPKAPRERGCPRHPHASSPFPDAWGSPNRSGCRQHAALWGGCYPPWPLSAPANKFPACLPACLPGPIGHRKPQADCFHMEINIY